MPTRLLLAAKLARPKTIRWHLARPQLQALLREGLSRKLTTVIAAAGHGKTCTLAHFLAQADVPYLWMQLAPADSDLSTFTRYLSTGISEQLGGGQGTLNALESLQDVAAMLPALAADLATCPNPAVVVLDDFHHISPQSPVVRLVSSLVQFCEDHVHFVICSRAPLPFPTARLKVIQEVTEVTAADLRFTPAEVRLFMRETAGITLEDERWEQTCHLTEGWPAALVLLTSSIRRWGPAASLSEHTLPADLFAFLADEVMSGTEPAVARFMEESSILDTCDPAVCDGVLERQDSAAMLNQILQANLLLLQSGQDSFRYHHLLQRFLQQRLQQRDAGETFRRLHRKAGDWYLAREMPEEAFRYYLQGGWLAEATHLVDRMAPLWLRTKRIDRLHLLTAALPQEVRAQYPWLTLCEARRMLNDGHHDSALATARVALRAFEERGENRGIVHALTISREVLVQREDFEGAAEQLNRALVYLQPEHKQEQADILRLRADATLLAKGEVPEVEADLRAALALYMEVGDLAGESLTADRLGQYRAAVGDYPSALRYFQQVADCSHAMGEPPYEGSTNLAWCYGHMGHMQEGIRLYERILSNSTRKIRRVYAALNLIQLYARSALFPHALAVAQTAQALVNEVGNRENKLMLAVDLAELYRLAGQPHTAVTYANEAMQILKSLKSPHTTLRAVLQTALLHLFHTGDAAAAYRVADRALARSAPAGSQQFYRMLLTMVQAVAEFRGTRSESRPEGVRILQEALATCGVNGYEFFAQHEWQLALSIVVYGFAYGVDPEVCGGIVRLMAERLPEAVLRDGIPLVEAEARLIPAAWQAMPDDMTRDTFSALLTPADRRRIVGLAVGPSSLRVQCLGPLRVVVGAEAVDVKGLRRRKSGQLLVLLLTQEGPLPREQLTDQLWSDLDADAADTSLRVSLHHLRRLLEPHLGGKSKSRYIQTEGGLVWFSRQPEVTVDLDEFRSELSQAEEAVNSGHPAEAAGHYESACRIYRGDLVADDPYSDALSDQRTRLRDRYEAALEWLGHYWWKEAADPARAILAFKQQLEGDEAHEPTHQALMRIYLEGGQIASARQQYLACRDALQRELGMLPSRATESLLQLALSMESETANPAPAPARRSARHG